MGLDKVNFGREVQQRQFGLDPAFFAIVIDPSTGGPGGSQMQLGVSYPVNINPCDSMWLPRCYDPSLGVNPAQGDQTNYNLGGYILGGATNAVGSMWGLNITDVYDSNPANPVPLQLAPIFSLQFNSNNAPWLLWSLSDFLVLADDQTPNTAGLGGLLLGGDAMRAISGPISSMNIKFLQWAYIIDDNTSSAMVDIPASRIVLLSSLGYSQQTSGASQPGYSSAAIGASGQVPQLAAPATIGTRSGGYVQTNLNTLDVIELEKRGLGSKGTLSGH